MSLDAKIEYLKMIQAVIARMSNYGFLLKGWGLTLIAAILALAAQNGNSVLLLVGLLPTIVFWGLDAFFLRTERIYRSIYDRATQFEAEDVRFKLTPTAEDRASAPSLLHMMLSQTLLAFWLAIAVVLLLGFAMIGKG